MNRYITPNATEELNVMIDMMIEGWNEVISGYFSHLFNSPGFLKAWLCIYLLDNCNLDNECDTLLSHLEHYYLLKGVNY